MFRKLSRRLLLRAVGGSAVSLTAGCESLPDDLATDRPASGADRPSAGTADATSQGEAIYDVELAPVTADPRDAVFTVTVERNDVDPTDYRAIGPLEVVVPEHVGIRKVVLDTAEEDLLAASVDLALGVGSEVAGTLAPFPVPDPGLATDTAEVIRAIRNQEARLPRRLTLKPNNPLRSVRYLLWLTADRPVDRWGYPGATTVAYGYKPADDPTSTLLTAGPMFWQFPACGADAGTPAATPTPTPTERPTPRLSFEDATPGDATPPDPWEVVQRDGLIETVGNASHGDVALRVQDDGTDLTHTAVGVDVVFDGIHRVEADLHPVAANPGYGYLKLRLDGPERGQHLHNRDHPGKTEHGGTHTEAFREGEWHRDVRFEVWRGPDGAVPLSDLNGVHTLVVACSGDNDAIWDDFRFYDADGEPVPAWIGT